MKNWKKFFGMLGALIFALGLNAMEFKSNPNVIAELEYFYAKDGTITGRRVNDSIQMYSYDKRGQLLAVIDGDGKPVEQYVYDPAGNILSKTVNGKTTTFTYDKANQLVNSTVDGKTTDYRYDGAGRLVQEGDKTYQYGYLDKILNVLENGETVAGFDYHMNGQIASSTTKDGTENFLWDGLALIHRGGTNYINEPAVTGGNPILADGNVLFNDMLGTTLGVKSGESFNQIAMTAFGDTENKEAMFTGKPIVGEIGYAFLFRNYRADQGKWQTRDPLGYPDGWNNFAYVNNWIVGCIDALGTDIVHLLDPNGAVLSAGHSAWIIGNETDGYTAYDYRPAGSASSSGSSSSGGSPPVRNFTTFDAALDYLNAGRESGHKYVWGQTLETTPDDDKKANIAAAKYMTESYGLFSHNCYQLGIWIVSEVNRQNNTNYNISTTMYPERAFKANLDKNWMQTAVE